MVDGRCLRFLASDKCEYRDVIVEDSPLADAWLSQAWRFLSEHGGFDYAFFQDLNVGSRLCAILKKETGGGWVKRWSSKIIDFSGLASWRDYEKQLPNKLSGDQKRQWRRLKRAGRRLEFNVMASESDKVASIDWILEKKIKWMSQNAISVEGLLDGRYRDFVVDLARREMPEAEVVSFNMTADGSIISAGMGFLYRGNFTLWNFAYDDGWRSLLTLQAVARGDHKMVPVERRP